MQLLIQALKRWWLHRLGFPHPEPSNFFLSLSKDQQLNAKRAENPPVSFMGFRKSAHDREPSCLAPFQSSTHDAGSFCKCGRFLPVFSMDDAGRDDIPQRFQRVARHHVGAVPQAAEDDTDPCDLAVDLNGRFGRFQSPIFISIDRILECMMEIDRCVTVMKRGSKLDISVSSLPMGSAFRGICGQMNEMGRTNAFK